MKPLRMLALLALAAIAAPAARADFIETRMDTSTPIMTFDIPSRGVNGESGYVGPSDITFGGVDLGPGYCTDLFRSIGVNDRYPASLAPVSSLPNASLLARLFAADAARNDSGALERAALQLAVWDVVETGRAGLGEYVDPLAFDPSRVDLGADHLRVYTDASKAHLLFGLSSSSLAIFASDGSGVLNRMDALLSAADVMKGPGATLSYFAPETTYGQGFVSVRSVPEPSSLALAVVGLGGFAAARFRWSRSHRSGPDAC